MTPSGSSLLNSRWMRSDLQGAVGVQGARPFSRQARENNGKRASPAVRTSAKPPVSGEDLLKNAPIGPLDNTIEQVRKESCE
jgi:hypothetical protein